MQHSLRTPHPAAFWTCSERTSFPSQCKCPRLRLHIRPMQRRCLSVAAYTSSPGSGALNPALQSFRLFGKSVREELVDTVKLYYEEIWSSCNVDLLDDVVTEDVVYNDVTIYNEEFVGRKRLRKIIWEYCSAYPTLKFEVVKAIADDDCESVLVLWNAAGASFGTRLGVPATGVVSHVSGMSTIRFDSMKRIQKVITYRLPFAEESGDYRDGSM